MFHARSYLPLWINFDGSVIQFMVGDKLGRSLLRIPVHILVGVQPRAGLGWEWDCKFEGCRGRGVVVDRAKAYDTGVEHWRQCHSASGGKLKNDGN